ncbi:MAG TPA: hypothetical protein VGM90_25085 [Kofleriaceae bacterium]|jgi:hypothetical protein
MMRRAWVVLVAACGGSHSSSHTETATKSPNPAFGPGVLAKPVPVVAADATPSTLDAAYAAPALNLEPATPSEKKCRGDAGADFDHEQQRERAALDHALRAKGLTPLVVTLREKDPDEEEAAPSGHWVAVDEVRGCHPDAPAIAMNSAHEVFVVTPNLVPGARRTVSECMGSCSGACGIARRPQMVYAKAPKEARVVPPRMLDVPIDVAVSITVVKSVECNVP